MVLIAFLYT